MLDPFLHWLTVAGVALFAGLVGGAGGRWLKARLELIALWDAIEALSNRLSKREGSAGHQRKVQSQAELAAFQQEIQQAARARLAAPEVAPLDEAEGIRRANALFAVPKDRGGTG